MGRIGCEAMGLQEAKEAPLAGSQNAVGANA